MSLNSKLGRMSLTNDTSDGGKTRDPREFYADDPSFTGEELCTFIAARAKRCKISREFSKYNTESRFLPKSVSNRFIGDLTDRGLLWKWLESPESTVCSLGWDKSLEEPVMRALQQAPSEVNQIVKGKMYGGEFSTLGPDDQISAPG